MEAAKAQQREEDGWTPAAAEKPLTERERFWWIMAAIMTVVTLSLFPFVLLVLTKMPQVAN